MSVKIYSNSDFPTYLPKLSHLYDDLFEGGKGFRAKLVALVSGPLHLDQKTVQLLSQTIEFIHNASLLHDDLIDRSHLRRGKPAAWTKYTPEYAVLAGDYLLARVMVNLSSHGNIELVKYTSQVISDLLEGEWLQDSVVGDFFVTLPQLDRIHNLKTASLFKWCLRAPFIAQNNLDENLHHTLEEMGTLLGQLFQRSDDLLDYDIRNHEGKAVLGDLKSGYLNSFGAFVSQNLKREQIEKMVRVRSLNEFYSIFSAEPEKAKSLFDEQVKSFDQSNQALIDLYYHHLSDLKNYLPKNEQADQLMSTLNKMVDLLYFRKS